MGISNNVLLSLGMVGALSIVRFRTPIKDPMDLVYIFWSIVSGILCGAGFIPLVVIGSVLIGIVLLVFVNKITVENPFLLIVKAGGGSSSEAIEAELARLQYRHGYGLQASGYAAGYRGVPAECRRRGNPA